LKNFKNKLEEAQVVVYISDFILWTIFKIKFVILCLNCQITNIEIIKIIG